MVEKTRQRWSEMSGFRLWWYNTVASFLLDVIQDLRNEIASKNWLLAADSDCIRRQQNKLDILSGNYRDLLRSYNLSLDKIKELESKRPEQQWVETAQIRASKQRIRDLESEVFALKIKLKNATKTNS